MVHDKTNDTSAAGPPASGAVPSDAHLVTDGQDPWAGTRMMVALAGAVVLLLGMRAAADVVAPIVLALVVAVGIAPAIGWLQRKGLGTGVAFGITVTVTVIAEIAIILLLSISLASFALSLPDYEDEIQPLWNSTVSFFDSMGVDVEKALDGENIRRQEADRDRSSIARQHHRPLLHPHLGHVHRRLHAPRVDHHLPQGGSRGDFGAD